MPSLSPWWFVQTLFTHPVSLHIWAVEFKWPLCCGLSFVGLLFLVGKGCVPRGGSADDLMAHALGVCVYTLMIAVRVSSVRMWWRVSGLGSLHPLALRLLGHSPFFLIWLLLWSNTR